MHAVRLCHSAFFSSQPRLVPSPLLQGLKRSASLVSPQITPAPWPSQRLFHHIRSGSAVRFKQPRHASFGWGLAGISCVIGGAAAIQFYYTASEKETSSLQQQEQMQQSHSNFTGIIDTLEMSSYDIAPGHVGNLTPEQEVKLREMWAVLFRLFNIKIEDGQLEKALSNRPESPDSKKKTRRGFFGFGGGKKEEPATPDVAGLSLSDHDDKYGMNKDFKQAVADLSPEQLRESLWSMLKADHPDALLLRFLRARKWDVNKAVVMLISTIRWRREEMHVDDDVMLGEMKALEQAESSDHETKRLGVDFMAQTRMGKSFIHGVDKQGRPICSIRVKMHKIGVHSEKSTERYTVHMIETARLMLPRPIETAVIMFDMTGFTMANMDYAPLKFIIKCFEANYPESLGAVLIHQAPWIFSGLYLLQWHMQIDI
ncbi:CRAL/TRIO domain protein [Talaromyces stipitatus ATCC 10500]|uniref:CRAL/TRIO domain protein n=1 Tax=Talaromyces stipitatus (strain ATCC 10500 / CBS 375.48 / QM 6759 / NRRL 1006) TaxID=441959 RepID=B8MAN4_TALSN|nr:CRAL/TRIO domain protein [Talaromyces stipitatus ATCC 10500]EED17458.1 CRAL/TRIO domain protein [Talaromyces stipitatus ATCC 10500]